MSLAMFGFHSVVSWAQVEDGVSIPPRNSLADRTDSISRSVVRYFQSQQHHLSGDLIVRSQVAEIQAYLRKTRGASPATNPKLRKRVLADQNYLARIFYGSQGGRLLREAAIQLGGYGPLDQLCQLQSGRQVLTAAIRQQNLKMLVEYTQKHEPSPESTRASSVDVEKKQQTRKLGNIYTVEDLLKALHPDRKAPVRSH